MLTPELIRRTECLGDTRMVTCSEQDAKLEAEMLFEDVRAAVDEGVPVHFCEVTWKVYVDGIVVWSVREALERTGGE